MTNSSDIEEHTAYWLERYKAARRAGLTRIEARRFADGEATLHMLRQCVDGGARPEQIARVVC